VDLCDKDLASVLTNDGQQVLKIARDNTYPIDPIWFESMLNNLELQHAVCQALLIS